MTRSLTVLNKLSFDLDPNRLPKHVAVIMDGNGRWASRRGLPRIIGHQRGVNTLKNLLRCCKEWQIPALTAYAFSTKNWGRPRKEVEFMMSLFERVLRRELREIIEENVVIRFIGNLKILPRSLQNQIQRSIDKTKNNTGIQLTIATNYGGRQEIVSACKAIADRVKQGIISLDEINEALFENYLYTANIPNPDLLIRTSGEMRISNFLLWQIAYSEIYVTSTLWPDFDRLEFHKAISAYQQRDRRFGKA